MSNALPASEALIERLEIARRAAHAAGGLLLQHFGRLDGYTEKSRANLVTVADREAESLIVETLERALPGEPIVREEGDGFEGAVARRGELDRAPFAWAVDPLDGTTNFVHNYPVFAVSIGLLSHGRPVMGIVYNPARDETFAGAIGMGATLNGGSITVSKTNTLEACLIATGFPYDRRERLDQLFALLRRTLVAGHGIRRAGAAALDLCDLAAGRLDAYYELGLSPWDSAAGQAIVEAAGGRVSAFDGGTHDLYAKNTVGTNGLVHEAMIRLLSE